MTKYPLVIQFSMAEREDDIRKTSKLGVDVENELLKRLVVEFQEMDPTLTAPFIRGCMVSQLRGVQALREDLITVKIHRSMKGVMEDFSELPFDFILGYWYDAVFNRTDHESRLSTTP